MRIERLKEPVIIAHRGFKKKYPENTLSAFDAAVDEGAVMIELDVTLSKDRKIVVIHDDTLNRTTNGIGPVSGFTVPELKTLDAGSWFSKRFKDEKIPTLTEILEKYANKTFINIEIKAEALDPEIRHDSIEKQVVDLVVRFNCINSVIISSFEKRIIQRINQLPERPRLSILSEEPANSEMLSFIKENKLYSWNADYTVLTQGDVDLMHRNGVSVFSYTINDKGIAERLFNMGVNGIFTDDIVSFM